MFLRKNPFIFIFRSKSFSRYQNPGIQRRIKILTEGSPGVENLNLQEDSFEEGEIDFNNAARFYDEYISEQKKLKKQIEFKRIERKYFSPKKYPNLLTWSEKEHIRHLFNTDPATWTPEKLSISFPATIDIIKKVLKSTWAPKDSERIKKHDERVASNWKAFERGQLSLPSEYESHLKTFTSRKGNEQIIIAGNNTAIEKVEGEKIKNKTSEFLSIITSYKNKNIPQDSDNVAVISNDNTLNKDNIDLSFQDQSYNVNRRKLFTLEELRHVVKHSSVPKSDEQCKIDEHFVQGTNKEVVKDARLVDSKAKDVSFPQKFEPKKIITMENHFNKENDKDLQWIRIPKEKRKKGCLYKVNDSYYDDSGDFLYKVPGMSKL